MSLDLPSMGLTLHQAHEAREMRIHAGHLASEAGKGDTLAERSRMVACGLLGVVSGDWTWPGLMADPIKAAVVVGCWLGLRDEAHRHAKHHPTAAEPYWCCGEHAARNDGSGDVT